MLKYQGFWAIYIKYKAFKNEGLTVTKVVFECVIRVLKNRLYCWLTVTKVVFELSACK